MWKRRIDFIVAIFFISLFLLQIPLFSFDESYEEVLNKAKNYYNKNIHTYYAFVIVQEKHGGKLREKERVRLFFRKKPEGQYYQFMKGKFEGLRVSYVPSRDGRTNFMAKETGWRGLIGVKKWGFHSIIKRVLYPHIFDVNQYHLGFIIEESIRAHIIEKENNLIKSTLLSEISSPLFNKKMIRATVELNIKKPFKGIIYKKAEILFDPETYLPLYLKIYDFDGSVLAYYYFKVFVPNIEIPDSIFDLHNPPPKPPVPDPTDS